MSPSVTPRAFPLAGRYCFRAIPTVRAEDRAVARGEAQALKAGQDDKADGAVMLGEKLCVE